MNEQIEQMIDKSGWNLVMGTRQPMEKRDYVVSPEQLKTFVELIVNSCANVPTLMWLTNEVNADVAVKIRQRILANLEVKDLDDKDSDGSEYEY